MAQDTTKADGTTKTISKKQYNLGAVEVKARRGTGNKSLPSDKLTPTPTPSALTDYLQNYTPVFLKSYGTGVASPGLRGTAAGHTKLYWNGINLTSSMRGMFDMNLMPLFILDEAELQYGNAGLAMGTGGFGGSLALGSRLMRWDSLRMRVHQSIGSFGLSASGLALYYNIPDSRWIGATRLYARFAENDFKFFNTARFGSPEERQKNAGFRQYGAMQQFARPTDQGQLSATLWYQDSYQQIPGLMTAPPAGETQRDASLRATIEYQGYQRTRTTLEDGTERTLPAFTSSLGISHDLLHYRNPLSGLDSRSITDRMQFNAQISPEFRNAWFLRLGVQHIQDWAVSPGYTGTRQQSRPALFASLAYDSLKRISYSAIYRMEWVNFRYPMHTGTVGASVNLWKKQEGYRTTLAAYGNVGRNANYPTLNDLYWTPGGNPNLKPESGYSAEGGLNLKMGHSRSNLTMKAGYFLNYIRDYILWQPSPAFGYWMADNLGRVNNNGLEMTLQAMKQLRRSRLDLNLVYTQTHSEQLTDNGGAPRPLIYVPRQQFKAAASLQIARIAQLGADILYMGERLTPDEELPSYFLVNASLGRPLETRKLRGTLSLRCNNLLNTSYQAIAWRAMPGRWWEVSVSALWKK